MALFLMRTMRKIEPKHIDTRPDHLLDHFS
jgi:hypothetical protein